MGIQFAPQLFSTVPSPKRWGIQPRPTVTGTNRHKKKYEVNNPKLIILLLPGPQNRQRQWRLWPRTRNRQCVQAIEYSGTTTVAAASQWLSLVISDHDGGVGRRIWARGLDNDNEGVNWGRRRYNASEWTSTTAEAQVCLQAAWGLEDDNGGVNWGSIKYNAFEWMYLTEEGDGVFTGRG